MRLFLLLVSLCFLIVAAKDWSKVDYDILGEEWEQGDEKEELEKEYDIQKKVQEKMRGKPVKVDKDFGLDDLNSMSFDEVQEKFKNNKAPAFPAAPSGGGEGGSMIFVKLAQTNWKDKERKKLAKKWVTLLQTASLAGTQVFNVDEKTFLIQVHKSWLVNDVLKFIAQQPEAASFDLNGKTYTKSDFYDDDGDEL